MTIHAKNRWMLPNGRQVCGTNNRSVIVDTGNGDIYSTEPCQAIAESEKYNATVLVKGKAIAVFETQAEADALIDSIAGHIAAGRHYIEISGGRITKSC